MNTEHVVVDDVVEPFQRATEDTHDVLSFYYARIAKIRLLSKEEEAELSRRILIKKDVAARNKLVVHNLRLARWVASKFPRGKLLFDDLVQEGNLGLLKAAQEFDYKRKVRFTAYAVWWIRESIRYALANQWELVRVPRHVVGLQHKVWNAFNVMEERLGREPSFAELVEELKLPARKVRWVLLSSLGRVNSFEEMAFGHGSSDVSGDNDELTFGQTLTDKTMLGPELTALAKEELLWAHLRVKEALDAVIIKTKLPERNLKIFTMYYGLDGSDKRKTLRQIGRAIGLTPEGVRQVIYNTWQKVGVGSREEFREDLFRIEELGKLVMG